MITCSNCLEELSPEEVANGHTPCCYAKAQMNGLPLDDLDGYHTYIAAMETSDAERSGVLSYVQGLPADSKKRRRSYSKPTGKDAWPGRLYEGTKKLRKKPLPPNKKSISVDITSFSDRDVYGTTWAVSIVHPSLKVPELVTGEDRVDARKKARQFIRNRLNSSITLADEIIEDGQTITIIFR